MTMYQTPAKCLSTSSAPATSPSYKGKEKLISGCNPRGMNGQSRFLIVKYMSTCKIYTKDDSLSLSASLGSKHITTYIIICLGFTQFWLVSQFLLTTSFGLVININILSNPTERRSLYHHTRGLGLLVDVCEMPHTVILAENSTFCMASLCTCVKGNMLNI